MINSEQLLMLKSILDKDKFGALIDLYIRDSGRLMQECRDALQHDQWQHLFESAHALKGSSANIGIKVISELAFSLESGAKENDRMKCLSLLGSMAEKQVLVIESLKEFNS